MPRLDGGRGVHPRHAQVLDVVLVDLIQRAVVPALEGAVIHQPVVRVLVGVEQTVPGDLRRAGLRGEAQDGRRRQGLRDPGELRLYIAS